MKILYLKDQIAKRGGMERVIIAKANALAQIPGNKVWLVVDTNRQPSVLPIDSKIQIINLDLDYSKEGGLWHVFKTIKKVRVFEQKIKSILNYIQPDIVIGSGGLENHFIFSMPCQDKFVFIRELHFISNNRRKKASNAFQYGLAFVRELLDHWSSRRYNCIVDVTLGDKEHHWKGDDRVAIIPNPIIQDYYHQSPLNQHVVITAGRLVMEKNYSSLIRSWGIVSKKHPDWKLEIWGDGIEKKELCQLIEANGLEELISINNYTDDILVQFSKASIFVLTSLMESFGMVITEAMSCGLPVVSYDCPYGPREIISEGKDGFLVPLGDEQLMAERICYLIEHEDIRQQMGAAAIEKSKQYSMDIIIKKWMTLFQKLLNNKKKKSSTMRIAHVVWGMKTGGVETMLVNIINEQVKTEEVRLFIINDFIDEFLVEKISPICLISRMKRKPGDKNPFILLKLNYQIWKYRPDIIHVHSYQVSKLIMGKWKIVRTIHNTGNLPDEYPKMKALYAISEVVKRQVIRQGFPYVKPIYNGILTKAFKTRTIGKPINNHYRLVQVSRLDIRQKGQDILLEALSKLLCSYEINNFVLYLIGVGGFEKKLHDMVKELDMEEYVVFEGLKSQEYIYNHLCDYDLFVQPSRYDGFGLTVAEAMAAKLPVLVSDTQGPMEVIGYGKYGMAFKSEDVEDLANKLKIVLQGGYDDTLIEKAYQHVCEEYDVATTARQYLHEYQEVIDSKVNKI